MNHQKIVSLDLCADGMKLAESVVDGHGMMLVAKGTVLTDKLISRLSAQNISSVCIEFIEQRSEEEILQHRQKIEEQHKWRFRKVMGNPLMQQFCDALIDYQVGKG